MNPVIPQSWSAYHQFPILSPTNIMQMETVFAGIDGATTTPLGG